MEALRDFAPQPLDGTNPQAPLSQVREIPYRLRRKTLKLIRLEEGVVPEMLWAERGEAVEFRTRDIIASQTDVVESVTMNAKYTEGSDLTVRLVEGFLIRELAVEVKSSGIGIKSRKKEIRDSLPPEERNADGVRKWMTENNFILINGSEEKSEEEILSNSFYPQLERIQQRAMKEQTSEVQIQIFPEVLA